MKRKKCLCKCSAIPIFVLHTRLNRQPLYVLSLKLVYASIPKPLLVLKPSKKFALYPDLIAKKHSTHS